MIQKILFAFEKYFFFAQIERYGMESYGKVHCRQKLFGKNISYWRPERPIVFFTFSFESIAKPNQIN